MSDIGLTDRVYLERVRQFYGHAIGNVTSALVGAVFIAIILHSAETSVDILSAWFSFVLLSTCIILIVQSRFRKSVLTPTNANRWVAARLISSGLIGLSYGVAPFLLPETVAIQFEMFLFIILATMVSIATTAFTMMPLHYFVLNSVTMIPLTIYLFGKPEFLHQVLLASAIFWQILVLSKALRVSKTSINAIFLNEQLSDEVEGHKKTKNELKHMATHDGLTGLPNRRLLMERLELIVQQANRYNRSIALMFLDLDDFKSINDTYGHNAGDVVLQEIAHRLEVQARESDIVARLGGDEFVAVYSDLKDKEQEPTTLAQRIIDALAEPVLLPNGEALLVGTSIGIATYPGDSSDTDDLIKAADRAMYIAKENGKNQFAFSG